MTDKISGPDGSVLSEGLDADAGARRPTALLDWGLYVDCPKCSLSNNLASGLHDVEHDIARRIFTNEWDKLAGWEVTCEGCGHEFLLGGVEY